ncbi:hypothetical protein U9M48_019908, partial [Paspalum notatum var. saurae]
PPGAHGHAGGLAPVGLPGARAGGRAPPAVALASAASFPPAAQARASARAPPAVAFKPVASLPQSRLPGARAGARAPPTVVPARAASLPPAAKARAGGRCPSPCPAATRAATGGRSGGRREEGSARREPLPAPAVPKPRSRPLPKPVLAAVAQASLRPRRGSRGGRREQGARAGGGCAHEEEGRALSRRCRAEPGAATGAATGRARRRPGPHKIGAIGSRLEGRYEGGKVHGALLKLRHSIWIRPAERLDRRPAVRLPCARSLAPLAFPAACLPASAPRFRPAASLRPLPGSPCISAASASFSNTMDRQGTKHRILMVSDFFFPNFGGVESHIYYLSQCLLKLGHKAIPDAEYTPYIILDIPNSLMHARTMGYKVVFTDHSLYGFADAGSIHMNKVLQFTLADIDQAICVSHTSKENTVLRSGISPEKVFMVPNAVDTAMFTPSPTRLSCDEIVIVVISRLVYRKGADLLVEVIPEVCRQFPKVRFIIGGDGPKRVRLEEMREKFSLQDRVEMLGAVPHAQVRSVLITGHIFLNSSLTEAFCIAILEAASCGLLTVSTRVGGVPEVLPDDMIVLAEPAPGDMVRAVKKAIDMLPGIDPQVMHLRMKALYSWDDVAKRTEIVYDRAMQSLTTNLLDRLPRYLTCGSWAGKLFCLVMIINYLLWRLLEFLQPAEDIDEVPDIGLLNAHLDCRDDLSEAQEKKF